MRPFTIPIMPRIKDVNANAYPTNPEAKLHTSNTKPIRHRRRLSYSFVPFSYGFSTVITYRVTIIAIKKDIQSMRANLIPSTYIFSLEVELFTLKFINNIPSSAFAEIQQKIIK